MVTHTLIFLVGLAALIAGAEFLVTGASRLALRFGVSPLIIGLTVVAFGTSTPEGAVTVGAALSGTTDLAMGNIVGSNILNLLLILGLTAMVAPLMVQRQIIRQEIPVMILATGLLIIFIRDGSLARGEAALLFVLLILYTGVLIWQARRQMVADPGAAQQDNDIDTGHAFLNRFPNPVLIVVGLALLALGGHWLVSSGTFFARQFGVSELVIGLTVVAVGTSLPELATAMTGALRGHTDLVVGNAVGSNMFNLLGCLGLAGIVSQDGLNAAPAVLNFDVWVMLTASLVFLPIAFTGRKISRWEGSLLFAYCLVYLSYTLMAATHHDALPAFSNVLIAFIVPLTAIVLLGSLLRESRVRGLR